MSAGTGVAGLTLRELGEGDRTQEVALGALAFGGDPDGPVPPAPPGRRAWGALDGGRLVAKVAVRDYRQCWGARPVGMGGVAGVAVHPDARGSGAVRALVAMMLRELRADAVPVSALFPTAPGIYRSLGWEVVGARDETLLPTAALRPAAHDRDVVALRSADPADAAVLAALWAEHAALTPGALTRDGPSWPGGPAHDLLQSDVVTLAREGDRPTGYVAYARGRGYGTDSRLEVRELVSRTAATTAALLASLATWDAVAASVSWLGPPDATALRSTVPPPHTSRPWMLRVVDAPGAIAARGFAPAVSTDAVFELLDPQVREHEGTWRLTVASGRGRLERAQGPAPRLHVRGLALLYAGVAGPDRLVRQGLLDGPAPALDVFAGPGPVLTDYF